LPNHVRCALQESTSTIKELKAAVKAALLDRSLAEEEAQATRSALNTEKRKRCNAETREVCIVNFYLP